LQNYLQAIDCVRAGLQSCGKWPILDSGFSHSEIANGLKQKPQGLRPNLILLHIGPTKVVPLLQNARKIEFIRNQ
jgi:hypothetical protein